MIPKDGAGQDQPAFSAYELQMLRGCVGNMRGWHAGFDGKGEWYIRPARRVTTPRSPAQQAVAARLKLASQAWRELPEVEKAEYRRRAKARRNTLGHYIFLKEFLSPPEPLPHEGWPELQEKPKVRKLWGGHCPFNCSATSRGVDEQCSNGPRVGPYCMPCWQRR